MLDRNKRKPEDFFNAFFDDAMGTTVTTVPVTHKRGNISHLMSGYFLKKIFGGHKSFSWGYWYPCFGLLVTFALGFKTRVEFSLARFLACAWMSGYLESRSTWHKTVKKNCIIIQSVHAQFNATWVTLYFHYPSKDNILKSVDGGTYWPRRWYQFWKDVNQDDINCSWRMWQLCDWWWNQKLKDTDVNLNISKHHFWESLCCAGLLKQFYNTCTLRAMTMMMAVPHSTKYVCLCKCVNKTTCTPTKQTLTMKPESKVYRIFTIPRLSPMEISIN